MLLARHLGLRLELLLCETQRAVAGLPVDERGAERVHPGSNDEGEQYLEALRQTMMSPGVEIGSEVIRAPSLAAGLAQKLHYTHAQIVVKAGRVTPSLVGPFEWQLLGRCAAPLLLTTGRPWRATPRFGAALDLGERAPGTPGNVVGLSEALARHCNAELDYLYAAPARGSDGRAASEAHRRLCALLPAGSPGVGRLQYCSGEPAGVLPRLVAGRDYDLLAVGAGSSSCLADCGHVTAALLRASAGDVLLVPVAGAMTVAGVH